MKTLSRFLVSLLAIFAFTCISYNSVHSQCMVWDWACNSETPIYHNSGWDIAKDIATDVNNNVIVVGDFISGELYFGSTILSSNFGHYDIFVAKYDEDGNALWAISGNGDHEDMVSAVDIDNTGDIYITGHFSSPTLSFGTTVLNNTNPGSYLYDVFVVKLDGDTGDVIWALSATGTGDDYSNDIVVDDNGNPIITGYFQQADDLTFGSFILTKPCHNWGMYMVKFTSTGLVNWGLCAEESNWGGCKGYSLTTDNQDNILVVGTYQFEAITFGSTTLTYDINQGEQMFLTKYDSDGDVLWAKRATGQNSYGGQAHAPRSIACDNSNNVFIAGYFDVDEISFGSVSLSSTTAPAADIFLVKYNSTGTSVWAKGAVSPSMSNNYGRSVSTDIKGNVYLTGHYNSASLTFDGTEQIFNTNTSTSDIFIAKYDNDGTIKWVQNYGSSSNEEAFSIVTDNNNDLLFCGDFTSPTLALDGLLLSNISGQPGDYDLLFGKLVNSIKPVFATTDVLCYGGSDGEIDLSVSGGTSPYNYDWSNSSTNEDITGLTAGTYSVTIIDDQGCEKIDSTEIFQPEELISSIVQITDVTCFGGSDGAIDINVVGGIPPYEYNWSNSGDTQDIDNLTADTYYVTVTDAHNCTENNSAVVNQPEEIEIEIVLITEISCNGESDGAIDIEVSGGTAPYTYLWSTTEETEDIDNLSADTYYITVTDAHACVKTGSVVVNEPDVLTSDILGSDVLCFGGNDGFIDLTPSGGTAPYSFEWSNSETSQNLTGLIIGTYDVTITDAHGCLAYNSATISQPDELVISVISASDLACHGDTDGIIDIEVAGGVGTYEYLWSNEETSQDIDNLTAGEYFVTVTDSHDCTVSTSAIVTQPDEIVITPVLMTHVSCHGENDGVLEVEITGGTAPYGQIWSNSATTTMIDNLVAVNYIITVTDNDGCTASESFEITQPDELSSDIFPHDVLCFGGNDGTIDLTVIGGTEPYAFEWSNSETIQNLTGLTIGTYDVTITDDHGCLAYNSASITEPDEITISLSSFGNVSCFGGNDGFIEINILGGVPPYSFSWSNEAETQNIDNLTAGEYHVTVSDSHDCTMSSLFNITEPDEIVISVISVTDANCFGDSNGAIDIEVAGGTGAYTYLWSEASETQDIDNIAAGTYTVTVTDENDCIKTAEIVVNQPEEISHYFEMDHICYGETGGSIDLTMYGGTPPYSYLWNTGSTDEDLFDQPAGDYSVTITDSHGCIHITFPSIIAPSTPISIDYESADVLCFGGNTGHIHLNVSGSVPPYTYLWSNEEATQNIDNLSVGTYSVTVTDELGCTATETIVINEPTVLEIDYTSTDVSCFGGIDGAIDLSITGGTAPYSYYWSNGSEDEDPTGLEAYVYSVFVFDHNNCSEVENVVINEPEQIVAEFDITNTCHNTDDGAITITVSGGTPPYSYIWSNDETTHNLSGLYADTYYVTVTDYNLCEAVYSAIVEQAPSDIEIDYTVTDVLCHGGNTGEIDLTVSGSAAPYSYSWSSGSTNEDISNLTADDYIVTVTDSYNCIAVETISISEPEALSIEFTVTDDTTNSCLGEIYSEISGGTLPYDYQWYDPQMQNTQIADSLCSGHYMLLVTDANGCVVSEIAFVDAGNVGIFSNSINQDFNVYPVPSDGIVNIDFGEDFNTNDASILAIINISGQIIYETKITDRIRSVDLSEIATSGLYFVQIYDENGWIIAKRKIIIEK